MGLGGQRRWLHREALRHLLKEALVDTLRCLVPCEGWSGHSAITVVTSVMIMVTDQ